jgi:hypothetical protein
MQVLLPQEPQSYRARQRGYRTVLIIQLSTKLLQTLRVLLYNAPTRGPTPSKRIKNRVALVQWFHYLQSESQKFESTFGFDCIPQTH